MRNPWVLFVLALLFHPVLCGRMQGCETHLSKLQEHPPHLQTFVAHATPENHQKTENSKEDAQKSIFALRYNAVIKDMSFVLLVHNYYKVY